MDINTQVDCLSTVNHQTYESFKTCINEIKTLFESSITHWKDIINFIEDNMGKVLVDKNVVLRRDGYDTIHPCHLAIDYDPDSDYIEYGSSGCPFCQYLDMECSKCPLYDTSYSHSCFPAWQSFASYAHRLVTRQKSIDNVLLKRAKSVLTYLQDGYDGLIN